MCRMYFLLCYAMMPMWASHINFFHDDLNVLCRHRITSGLDTLSRREEGFHDIIYVLLEI